MGKRTCSIEGCDRTYRARGWCHSHLRSMDLYGDPLAARLNARTPEESFAANTVRRGDCLIWTGHTNQAGYGLISVGGKQARSHRYAWERVNGPIPDGMILDHRYHCDVRCCEVEHLRLATQDQNKQNLSGPSRNRRYNLPRGVYRNRKGFTAQVQHQGVTHCLGTYPTVDEAEQAAVSKRAELFGEYAGRSRRAGA